MNPAAIGQAESSFIDFNENLSENRWKSAATLKKRANALFLLVQAAIDRDKAPLPILESEVAHYFFQLRRSGTFTSRASSLSCIFVEGLEGELEACASGRVKGASDSMLAEKKTWSPADPFRVEEAKTFHHLLRDLTVAVFDRLAAGTVLAMIYGRRRA